MDDYEKREIRRIVREEITLAMRALDDAADWAEGDRDALTAVQRTVQRFLERSYPAACEEADEHEHRYTWADDGTGNSGSVCVICGEPEPEPGEALVRKAAGLPPADMDALDPDVRDALRGIHDSDVREALVRFMFHGAPGTEQNRQPLDRRHNPFV